ncbi:hypothetical protein Q7C36_002933 [Tachysurus vachellii]|uniref:Uncharacterized protein n=1 Tax=Tachysurus vachellii TaxID=175792 RepID=A0AA88P2S8_TACVA|nr:hypothetical protein Q7C36_002933 [Tachysurus vachellii]
MLFGLSEQDILEVFTVMYNSLKEIVLSLKANSPKISQRPKSTNHFRIVFQKVMFGENSASTLSASTCVLIFWPPSSTIISSENCPLARSSIISSRSSKISQGFVSFWYSYKHYFYDWVIRSPVLLPPQVTKLFLSHDLSILFVYMCSGLAKSTLKMYDSALSHFSSFCATFNVDVLPVNVSYVSAFIVHCFESCKIQPSSILHPAYARRHPIPPALLDPSTISLLKNSSIRLLLNGLKKEKPKGNDPRLPLTLPLLQKLMSRLREGCFEIYSDIMLESVLLMAFYGFLRARMEAPLFTMEEGKPMSRSWFASRFRLLCQYCGLPPEGYSAHSLRIGAATTAASSTSVSTLKTMGRWSSAAYERYLRPDTRAILEAQKAMSDACDRS